MKFQTYEDFMSWMTVKLEEYEADETDFEDYELTEEDEAEVSAFSEIVSKIAYNYGRLKGIAKAVEEFGGLGYSFAETKCQEIQQQIDIGVEVIKRYFERVGES